MSDRANYNACKTALAIRKPHLLASCILKDRVNGLLRQPQHLPCLSQHPRPRRQRGGLCAVPPYLTSPGHAVFDLDAGTESNLIYFRNVAAADLFIQGKLPPAHIPDSGIFREYLSVFI